MKKIIISTYDSLKNPYFGGGGGISIHEVAKRLTDSFDITIITGTFDGKKDSYIDGVHYKKIGLKNIGPKLGQIVYSLMLPFYVLREQYDLWIESFTPPVSTGFLQLFTKKPVIGLVHMLAAKDMQRKYFLPFQIIENLGLKSYKNFIVNTLEIKKKIQNLNKSAEINLIGNGIQKVQGNSRRAKYALFAGRLEKNQKGLDLLIRAWKNVNINLVIAGNGDDLETLKELTDKYKLRNKIEFKGWVKGNQKDSLFKNAAFVVVPSRFETYSISALEAFSYGLPIVSFNIEGLKWTPKNSALKVKPFDINAFASACNKLARNKKLAFDMGLSGKSYAKNLTWDKITQKYINVIRNLTGKTAGEVNKRPSLSVGIPVFNEESTIEVLIKNILHQKSDNYILNNIIISTDNPTDNTIKILKSIKNSKIKLIENQKRKGVARGINQIIKISQSQILVTLDGDIVIKDKSFIDKLIEPMLTENADLVSSAMKENKVRNFFSNSIKTGMELKNILFNQINNGNNIYTCHGTARAYSKRFYKKLFIPTSIGNDMYTYLACLKFGYKFVFSPDAIVWYSLPDNFEDYIKQSTRFFNSQSEMEKYFNKNDVQEAVTLNSRSCIKAILKSIPILIKKPVYSLSYYFIQMYSKFISSTFYIDEAWSIAASTKRGE